MVETVAALWIPIWTERRLPEVVFKTTDPEMAVNVDALLFTKAIGKV
jgi:hypothetical protein